MKTHKTIFTALLFFLFGTLTSHGETLNDSVRVHFRVSRTEYDPNYKGNQHNLDSIFKKIKSDSLSGPSYKLLSVKVTGAASPEGSIKFNQYLSEKRADAIFNEFRKRGFINDTTASFTYLGRDWEGLRHEVENDTAVPYKEDVKILLTSITSANPPEHPLASLKGLHNGLPYRYLLNNIFPRLRESTLIAQYERLYPDINLPELPLSEPALTTEIEEGILQIPYNRLVIPKDGRPF